VIVGKFYAIAGLLVLALVLAPVGFLALRKKADYGDRTVLYQTYSAKVKSIDPATCGDTTSASMQGQVYESLYTYHYLKRPVEIIPQLAAEMPEISEDSRIYTFRLKPNIHYAPNPCFGIKPDGSFRTRTVRADDFALGLKRVADFHLQTPLAWSFLSERIVGLDEYRARCEAYREGDFSRYDMEVEGLEAVDDLTLRIHLKAPFPQLIYVLAMQTYAPVPRELIDYHLATEPGPGDERRPIPISRRTAQITQVEQIVGTGPYQLTHWQQGALMVFERNPEYRHGFYPTEGEPGDAEAGLLDDAGKPLPFVDVLHYECILEDMPAWLRFLSRQTDVSGIPRDVFDTVITPDRDLLDKWAKQGLRLSKFTDPTVFWLAFNMDDPVMWASKSLRHAMCLAFNVEDLIEVLYNGRGRRAVNVLPSSFPAHPIAGPGPYYRYDMEEARRQLDQARSELAAVGRLDANDQFPLLTVDLGGRDETSRRMGEFIRQQFEPLGLRVRIELNDWPTLQQKVHNKQCQLYAMGWHADYPDAENFLQLYYGPNIEKGTNNSNYRNPEFDALYDQVTVMPDEHDRNEVYARMVHMLNEDCPVLLLVEPMYYVLTYDWVKGYKRHPFAYGMTKHLRIDTQLRREMGGR